MKQSYVVMNLDTSEYWWVDSANSPEEAIQEYVDNCFQDEEATVNITMQAVAVSPKSIPVKDYSVKISKVLKTEITDGE
jgi:poly(3-hydroxyalkanoate) synthetase